MLTVESNAGKQKSQCWVQGYHNSAISGVVHKLSFETFELFFETILARHLYVLHRPSEKLLLIA